MSRFGNLEFDDGKGRAEQAASKAPGEEILITQAEEAYQKGRFEEALRSFSKSLEFNPLNPIAWLGQVRILIELEEFEEAKVWADKALQAFPDEPELLAAKGVALGRLGDLAGAISFSDAAVESQASTPYIWLARADVLLARKEKRADYCFEKALSLAGQNWFVIWIASRIQAYYQHFARSLKLAREALSIEPSQAVLWLQVGQCELALGLTDGAQRSLEQARELDPDSRCPEQLIREAASTSFLDKLSRRWWQWFQK